MFAMWHKVLVWAVGLLQTPPKAIKLFPLTVMGLGISLKPFLKVGGDSMVFSVSGFPDFNSLSSFHMQLSKCCSAVLCVIFFYVCALTMIFWNSFHRNEIVCISVIGSVNNVMLIISIRKISCSVGVRTLEWDFQRTQKELEISLSVSQQ